MKPLHNEHIVCEGCGHSYSEPGKIHSCTEYLRQCNKDMARARDQYALAFRHLILSGFLTEQKAKEILRKSDELLRANYEGWN